MGIGKQFSNNKISFYLFLLRSVKNLVCNLLTVIEKYIIDFKLPNLKKRVNGVKGGGQRRGVGVT